MPVDHEDHHRWQSESYIEDWLARDITHDDERREVLRHAFELARAGRNMGDDRVRVLDVGGGYGLFAGVVLEALPSSAVVLHDFSEPMLVRAETHLADVRARVEIHRGDLHDDAWHASLDRPFDAVVSALAIHNLREHAAIRRVYADVATLLGPDGFFLNVDLVAPALPSADAVGSDIGSDSGFVPLETQLRWLREAGFEASDCLWKDGPQAAMVGLRS